MWNFVWYRPVDNVVRVTNSFQFANIRTMTSAMELLIQLTMRVVVINFWNCSNLLCFTINSIHCPQCGMWCNKRSRRRAGLISWNSNWMCPSSTRVSVRKMVRLLLFAATNEIQVYKVLEDALIAKNKAERDLKTYTNLVRHTSSTYCRLLPHWCHAYDEDEYDHFTPISSIFIPLLFSSLGLDNY